MLLSNNIDVKSVDCAETHARGPSALAVSLKTYQISLNRSPLGPHICVSESDHHWFRQWFVAYSAPSHYLRQCWVIVNWNVRNKLQWYFNQNVFFSFMKMHKKTSPAFARIATVNPPWSGLHGSRILGDMAQWCDIMIWFLIISSLVEHIVFNLRIMS